MNARLIAIEDNGEIKAINLHELITDIIVGEMSKAQEDLENFVRHQIDQIQAEDISGLTDFVRDEVTSSVDEIEAEDIYGMETLIRDQLSSVEADEHSAVLAEIQKLRDELTKAQMILSPAMVQSIECAISHLTALVRKTQETEPQEIL